MPWLSVNQTRLASDRAVPTPDLALDVQRAGRPGAPGAMPSTPVMSKPAAPPSHPNEITRGPRIPAGIKRRARAYVIRSRLHHAIGPQKTAGTWVPAVVRPGMRGRE